MERAAPETALEQAVEEVGDRWTLLLVAALLDGPQRFGDLERSIPSIAPNVLSDRLRRLERHGLALPEVYCERPRRYVYGLSAAGRELAGVLRMLAGWGARRRDDVGAVRHGVCGTELEARWYCPSCERTTEDAETDDVQFA